MVRPTVPRHNPKHWQARIWRLFGAAGLVLVALTAGAEPGVSLTLEEAVAQALAASPRILATEAGAQAAAADASAASWSRLPRVDLGVGASRTDNPVGVFSGLLAQGRFTADDFGTFDPAAGAFDLSRLNHPDPLTNIRAGVNVTQPLWTGGATTARIRAGRARAGAAQAGAERTRQEIAYDTERVFRRAVLADERLEVLRASLALAETEAARVESLWAVGLALQSDRRSLQAHVEETAARLASARAESVEARSLLGWTIGGGEPVTDPLHVDDTKDGSPAPPLAEALDRSETRGDVRASQLAETAARAQTSAARAALFPALNLTAGAERNLDDTFDHGQNTWRLGLELQWTLDAGTPARIQAARLQAQAAAQSETAALTMARHEVRTAHARLEAAVLRVSALEAAESAADDAHRLVQERHQEGLATTLELTQAEDALTRTRLAAASARHELALARSAVALAAGTLELPETRP